MNYMENNLKPVCKSMKSMISERDSDEDSDNDEGLVTIEALREHISNTFELFKDDVSSRLVYTRCIQNWYQVYNNGNEVPKLDPTYFKDLKLDLD
jgi:hypothetical protein